MKKGPFLWKLDPESLVAHVRTEYERDQEVPDTQLILRVPDGNKISIRTVLLTEQSRGFIKLNSTVPIWGPPLIYFRFLTAEPDQKRIIQGMGIALSVFNTTTVKSNNFVIDETLTPPCDKIEFNSDEYWTCLVRRLGF